MSFVVSFIHVVYSIPGFPAGSIRGSYGRFVCLIGAFGTLNSSRRSQIQAADERGIVGQNMGDDLIRKAHRGIMMKYGNVGYDNFTICNKTLLTALL
jgi:hypothetical protein